MYRPRYTPPPDPASAIGRVAQRPMTRRALLASAGQVGAGALVASLAGTRLSALAAPTAWQSPATSQRADVATAWFRLVLQLIQQTPGYTPPVTARALGYLGVTLYEALVAGIPGYRSLSGQLNGLTPPRLPQDDAYHWPLVANQALAATTRHLFPTATAANRMQIDVLEATLMRANIAAVPSGIMQRSMVRGALVAAHVAAWALPDGGHEGYLRNAPSTYTPPVGPGLWVPTPPALARALQPSWGQNRPFLLASGAEVDPGPHPAFSTEPGSTFDTEAREVYQTVNQLSAEQRAIALFWADDPGQTATPPGHCVSILTQVLDARAASLAVAAEAYARVGIALADAFISCWHSKYVHNLLRPITYIQRHIDSSWGNPLPVTTPPFPEYPSGHSVQTSAFAQVMTAMFGDLPFTDRTHEARGLPARSFTSWEALAEEAAISRLYGGIHYRAAIERGRAQGWQIGQRVSAMAFKA
jgi:hypothetical protein